MKSKLSLLIVMPVLLLVATGCNAPVTSFIGHQIAGEHVVRSEVEVFGSEGELVFLSGSYIPKLAVFGHNNRITLEAGAAVARVDLFGEGNEVVSAQGMPLIRTQFGHTNLVATEGLPQTDE